MKTTKKNSIAFLDFEFGQIYGSHRRDFLVTEASVLIYNQHNDTLQLAELILKPNTNVVLRKKYRTQKGKLRKLEKVYNLHANQVMNYDKNFKQSTVLRKESRSIWNKMYYSDLTVFLNTSLKGVEDIYVFGGSEDINLLKRYKINYNNIIDIQSILQKQDLIFFPDILQSKLTKNKQHSLDFFIDNLNLTHTIDNQKLLFHNYSYDLPSTIKSYTYDVKNFQSHCASGDCIRLFSLYKSLIDKS